MRARLRLLLVTLIASVACAACAAAVGAASAQAVAITEFSAGLNAYSHPGSITAGADGNLWFTDVGCDGYPGKCAIGRITTAGAITEFSGGTLASGAAPQQITSGPDGNLWFTVSNPSSAQGGSAIGRITPTGAITEFTNGLNPGSLTQDGITAAGGNLWFTDDGCDAGPGACAIGRITPAGAITEFGNGLSSNSEPGGIATGSDGNLWFSDITSHAIGRITPAGAITEFTSGLPDGSEPEQIASGPDGNIWFSDIGTHAIGRITPAGAITEYSAGLNPGSGPQSLAAGPDGNLWFADAGSTPAIGRITPAGAITEYPIGVPGSGPAGITEGPDGDMWFTDFNGDAIGRLALQLAPVASTGGASSVTDSRATVAATVNPLGGAVSSVVVRYGPTTAYGSSTKATPATLPSGGRPVGVTAVLQGLAAHTTIHYRVEATNPYGTTAGADRTFTTAAAVTCPTGQKGNPPQCVRKPTLSRAHQAHRSWRESGRRGRHSPPVGTTFSFRLNTAASVRFAFTHRVGGRRAKGRCVAQTRANRHHRECTRDISAGTLTVKGKTGSDRVSFRGRVSRSHTLKRGSYTVAITASDRAGNSKPEKLSFTIVK